MWNKSSKSSAKLPCLNSGDCLLHHHHHHQHQIANVTCNEEKIAEKTSVSSKEGKINFQEIISKDLESLNVVRVVNEHPVENNSSFLHAVINMVGMLIGTIYYWFPFFFKHFYLIFVIL